MPKATQFQKGSIIYFENDKDDKIYILQQGLLLLASTDIETGETVTSQITTGEFFGVKSALGHFPREETVTVLRDSITISMTVQEFETIFANNKQVVYKMLRVFSGQLREMHKRSKAMLTTMEDTPQNDGLLTVAKCFFQEKMYRSCVDVCIKYLTLFPDTPEKNSVLRLAEQAKPLADRTVSESTETTAHDLAEANKALAQFALPAFERFQKKYKKGQVIICEHEPGDAFYLIQSGDVQLVKCVNNSVKKLDILKPGEFFGEMAILDKSPRSATCIANGEVQCLEFNKQNFEVLVTGNPQIAIILLKLFCKRIYDQRRRFRILTLKDPAARVADVFCMYEEMNPPVKPSEKSRRFNIKAQDIAQWAGLPIDVVQDEIGKFSSKNKLEVFDNYMIIANIMEMKNFVEAKINMRHL